MISTLDTYVILICLPWVTFMFESFLSVHLNEQTFTTELNRSEGCQVWITKHEHFGAFKIDMIVFFHIQEYRNIPRFFKYSATNAAMWMKQWASYENQNKSRLDTVSFHKIQKMISRSVRVSLSNMIILLIVHWCTCRFCIWYMYSNEHNR